MTRGAMWWTQWNRKKMFSNKVAYINTNPLTWVLKAKKKMFENKNCLPISPKMFLRINIVQCTLRTTWTTYFSTNHLFLNEPFITCHRGWQMTKNGINDSAWLALEFQPKGCSRQTNKVIFTVFSFIHFHLRWI